MGTQAADVQQQVIEKTNSVLQKSQNLVWSMEKRLPSNKAVMQEPFSVCLYILFYKNEVCQNIKAQNL